jgi:hypothetical protein
MSHLRLVKPAGPKPPRRKGQRPPSPFSPDEQARLRVALRNARALFGTWACLADAMHVREKPIQGVASGRRPVSADLAVRLARALGKPLEALIRPPSEASTCAACGRRS